ncbi:MAG: DnaA family protein [Parasphingorhabdus sp.]|jgi:DnaA family protein
MTNTQVSLPLKLAENYALESFYTGANEELFEVVRAISDSTVSSVLYVWGEPGFGKSHLLQGLVQQAIENQQLAAYIPLSEKNIRSELIGQLQPSATICIDDVDNIAGDRAWEQALLDLFERCRTNGGRLVVSASKSPAGVDFILRDLQTRLTSELVYRINPLDDRHKALAIKWRAKTRGLAVSDQTVQYLLRRVSRAPAALFGLMDRIDKKSLQYSRPVTIPFLKELGIT